MIYRLILSLFLSILVTSPGICLAKESQNETLVNLLKKVNQTNSPQPCCNHQPHVIEDKCANLPPVLDENSPSPFEKINIDKLDFSDSLVHHSCTDFEKCLSEKSLKLSQPKYAMITSRARVNATSLKIALNHDRLVSRFAVSSRGKHRGLCDISFHSSYAIQEIEQCLKMPGMIGVGELNLNGEGTFSRTHTTDKTQLLIGYKGIAYKKFEEISKAVANAGGGVISVHFGDTHDSSAASTEVDALIEIANKYPQNTFIILHIGKFHGEGSKSFGLSGLKAVGDYYAKNPGRKQNIWSDLSGVMGDYISQTTQSSLCNLRNHQSQQAQAWRTFGIERVLFGTDDHVSQSGYEAPNFLETSLRALMSNPYLTRKEKEQILIKNIKNLFDKYPM